MAASYIFLFTLWMASLFNRGHGCPGLCTCSDKHERHFAECSYKDLEEIPSGLPPNVTTLSLSANRISVIPLGSFDNVTRVTSLWMAHNQVVSIEDGALAPLAHLRNFDISHNRIVDFPWDDLQNLTALQLLKMNHNEMVRLPKDAFVSLRDLRSLRLNNNRFLTVAEGTLGGLVSLSHIQLYNNSFACTCSIDWLRDWISSTTISVPEQNLITCASPQRLKGVSVVKLPESKCTGPNVTIRAEPNVDHKNLYEESLLILTCEFKGNPKPAVVWRIHTESQREKIVLASEEDDSSESVENTLLADKPFKIYNNGTIVISHTRKEDSGNYSCLATNEFGTDEDFMSIVVSASPKPTPDKKVSPTPFPTKTHPSLLFTSLHQPVAKISVPHPSLLPDLARKAVIKATPSLPLLSEITTEHHQETFGQPSRPRKCGLTSNTRYISNHAFNGSLEDVKQYTFDFGVIALGVSQTEARVRLNPLLIPKDKTGVRLSSSEEPDASEEQGGGKAPADGLYLCVSADHQHSAVQWSRIKEGVNTYLFTKLRAGTNYSLCLTYKGGDCEVQVLFTTRRKVPNLLIIISVSICLLTVSTVPLLGATCFHLVYKYRGKTYKLILKAKDQYHMERNLAAHFNLHAPHTESQRNINGSVLDEVEGETESGDGDKERDTNESMMTESFSMSQSRGNLEDCEAASECSDRLPLGAEAVNITSNYRYPSQ